jgi:cobalt-zinc-cadmium efflux system outer membrane protein
LGIPPLVELEEPMKRPKFIAAALAITCHGFAVLLLLGAVAASAQEVPRYTLKQLIVLAQENNRSLQAAADQVEAARAGIDSASAFPNPELEASKGHLRARLPDTVPGNSRGLWLSQPIDFPWLRSARIGAADAAWEAAKAEQHLSRGELLARLRYRFYELLRQEAELAAAREVESTLEQIAKRVKLRVESGEAPRFESIKADTELLSAKKTVQSGELRIRQTRAYLRQMVGAGLPAEFGVDGSLEHTSALPDLTALRAEAQARNPELARSRALTRQAERTVDQERSQRWPRLALKAGYDETPDARDSRIGLVLTVPLWDRRSGPVAEAEARLSKARNEAEQQSFALEQNLEAAWQQWQIAAAQVAALESGIVKQAEAALKVAEAAYRYGERGILEYLDAQRVYRAARNDLIAARFDQQVAALEIDRLVGRSDGHLGGTDTDTSKE